MDGDNQFQFVERFYSDIIGLIIPSIIFIISFLFAYSNKYDLPASGFWKNNMSILAMTIVVSSYAVGHLLNQISELFLWKLCFSKLFFIKKESELNNYIKGRSSFKEFVKKALNEDHISDLSSYAKEASEGEVREENNIHFDKLDLHQLRSLSMSMIPMTTNHKVYKFMFSSIMCINISLVLLVMTFSSLFIYHEIIENYFKVYFVTLVASYLLVLTFLMRFQKFRRRALEVPFSKAIVEMSG